MLDYNEEMALLKLTGEKVPVPSLPHRPASKAFLLVRRSYHFPVDSTTITFNHVSGRETTTQPSRGGEYGSGSLLHLVSIVMHWYGYLDLQIVYL